MKNIKYKAPSNTFKKMSSSLTNISGRPSDNINSSIKEYYLISVNSLRPYSKQSRKNFSEEEIKSLAESIKNFGIRQPLSVIRCEKEPGNFEIISGERRARAAKLIGLDKVPCIIINDIQNAEAVAVIENVQRKDLHPVELARAYAFLKDNGNFRDLKDMWRTIGVNETSGYEILNILKLPLNVQEKLLNYQISRQQLRTILKSKNPEEALGFFIKGRKSTSKSVIRINIENNDFSVQKQAIDKLNLEQKSKLKNLLENLLKELRK